MVRAERETINKVFLQTLFQNDRVLLKTVLEGTTRTKSSCLKQILTSKDNLNGFTPLQYACLKGQAVTASMLIDTGSTEINDTGKYGWTSLHAAVYSGDFRTVQVLLQSCADCFAKDENGNLPIDYARDAETRKVLNKAMKRKNLERFNELQDDLENQSKTNRANRRSQSCFPNISLQTLHELKSSLSSEEEITSSVQQEKLRKVLKKWKTYTDLSLQSIS
ncbi:protein phosphatase 1 regulatory subunit 16A-like [Hydractinia symbiolongicarpus]|uniref:protein phosphatase 1 regulatory subunit 16A-like n=1 Tax=Hydractinia symbiolongicarpus TaxID=13093 RepID=UPI00254CC9A2|nr:protein phosphatase 1 regulatory subunit 16A-like [Hydractinia symbiolongicarpus]